MTIKQSTPITSDGFNESRERIHRQMLSTVSHDLKTPLSTIIGSLQIYTRMGDKLDPEKKAMLIKAALGEAYRLDNFITNILDMAKLESGMVKTKSERCDMHSILEDCITQLGPRAERGSIALYGEKASSYMHTDPMLLGRAVGIVLDNALKHAGRQPSIHIHYGCDDTSAYVTVRDDGAGILPGKEEEIFSKYTRFDRSDQQNAGTGLGLAICRQLMELLSGAVSVRNHPQGGAEFTLRIRCQ